MPRYLGIVSTTRDWLDKAESSGVFHFPPNRKPNATALTRGDICLIYLHDERVFAGEFRVVEARRVWASEFYKRYRQGAVETRKAPFPKTRQEVTVIVYRDLQVYPRKIKPGEIPTAENIGPLGFFRILSWNKYEKLYKEIIEKATAMETLREHEKLKQQIAELGRKLGFHTTTERLDPQGLYKYDVTWSRIQGGVPAKVFEIHVHADIDRTLARLKHALDTWNKPDLFLVITSQKDKQRVEKLLGTRLEGAFHELKPYIQLVTTQDIDILLEKAELLKKLAR